MRTVKGSPLATPLKKGRENWKGLAEHPERDVAVRRSCRNCWELFLGRLEWLQEQEKFRTLRGDFCQELFHFDVGEDDVGLPLKGFVVTPFEPVSFLRRADERSSLYEKVLDLDKREFGLIIQEFIDADDQLREGVKPGKPRIVQHQLQQLAG